MSDIAYPTFKTVKFTIRHVETESALLRMNMSVPKLAGSVCDEDLYEFATTILVPGKIIETFGRFDTWHDHLAFYLKRRWPRIFRRLQVNYEDIDIVRICPYVEMPDPNTIAIKTIKTPSPDAISEDKDK